VGDSKFLLDESKLSNDGVLWNDDGDATDEDEDC
jgi:hypothetical protein